MYFNLQPILQNDLVLLRPLENSYFDPLYQVASDPLIWVQHPCNDRYKLYVFHAFFDYAIKSKGAFIIIDQKTNQRIGSTRFKMLAGVETAVEIGWSFLAHAYWGGHYNKSIKQLMCNYAFKTVDNVIFYIGKNNIRSQKAVEKIGGMRISSLEFKALLTDNPDTFTYRINKNEWNP